MEDFEKHEMSNGLRAIFDRNTRSKMLQKRDKFEPVAGWKHCYESIIKLSCDKFILNKAEMSKNSVIKWQKISQCLENRSIKESILSLHLNIPDIVLYLH